MLRGTSGEMVKLHLELVEQPAVPVENRDEDNFFGHVCERSSDGGLELFLRLSRKRNTIQIFSFLLKSWEWKSTETLEGISILMIWKV